MQNPENDSQNDEFSTFQNQIECQNCGYIFSKNLHFCGNCGQDTRYSKVTFLHFITELIEGLFNFDAKIWLTIRQLFQSPGVLVKNYNDNKRARYVSPVRFYIFISVLFFLTADTGFYKTAQNIEASMQKERIGKGFSVMLFSQTQVDSLTATKLFAISNITEEQVTDILKSQKISSSKLNIKIIQNIVHLKRKEVSAKEIVNKFVTLINKILFILMPIFAFLVWLIVNSGYLFYTEALVFSIYFHSLYFILMMVSILINKIVHFESLYYLVYVIACIYIVLSMKVAFSETWKKAIQHSTILIICYTVIFSFIFLFTVISSIIF